MLSALPDPLQRWLSPHGRLTRAGFNIRLLIYSVVLLIPMLWGWVFGDTTQKFQAGLAEMQQELMFNPTAPTGPTTPTSALPKSLLDAFSSSPTETFVIFLLYLSLAPTLTRRAKDLGWRPAWVLTILYARATTETLAAVTGLALSLPGGWAWLVAELLVMTALSLWPGEDGPNRYGRDPLQPPSTLVPK
mgnify:CR=1 FL=1